MTEKIISHFLRFSILMGTRYFTNNDVVFGATNIVVIEKRLTWIDAVLECRNKYHGNLIGARDPVFKEENITKAFIRNLTVWTGTYMSAQVSSWFTFIGCFIVSTSTWIEKEKRNARVYDCSSFCRNRYIFVGVNKQGCRCSRFYPQRTSMDNCSIDVDGNSYGNTANTVALYGSSFPGWNRRLKCVVGYSCESNLYTLSKCYSTKNVKNFVCRNGDSFYSRSWINAQRYCMASGSYLFQNSQSTHCYENTYLRRYEEIRDLVNDTDYDPRQMAHCQTVTFSNGVTSEYYGCNDTSQMHSALCKSRLPSPGHDNNRRTTETVWSTKSTDADQSSFTDKRVDVTTMMGDLEENTINITSNDKTIPVELMVGIAVPIVTISALIILLLMFIYRRKRKSSESTTNETVRYSSFHGNDAGINVGNRVSRSSDESRQVNTIAAEQEGNYHVLENQTRPVTAACEDTYYISDDSVYDELHKRRKRNEPQNNEYGTIKEFGDQDDIYRYDVTGSTLHVQVHNENLYDTTEQIKRETEGIYDYCQENLIQNENLYDSSCS